MIGRGLKHLGFKPGIDFNCQDDGEGPYIAAWLSESPQPSQEAIAIAEAAAIRNSAASALSSSAEQARALAVSNAGPLKVIHYKEKDKLARAALAGNVVAREALNPEALDRGLTIDQMAGLIILRAAQALGAAQRVSDAETAATIRLAEATTPEQMRVAATVDWADVLAGPALDLELAAPVTPEPTPFVEPQLTAALLRLRLAAKFADLRATPVANNFEADDLKLCAEFAAHAAEGVTSAIQALTPLATAAGVSVEDFIESELARESARRARVLTMRAAQIAFGRLIDAASEEDLSEIDTNIAAYSA